MASAVKYLHGLEPKIIFRDLSAANVLLTATKAGQADAKLIDFGLAKETTRERISPEIDGIACTLYPSDLVFHLGVLHSSGRHWMHPIQQRGWVRYGLR